MPKIKFILIGLVVIAIVSFAFFGKKLTTNPLTNILNKLPGKQTAGLQQQLNSLYGGTGTITTKEAGIAVCKKNGSDDCYALVAVSFNDMSVCKSAIDKAACESQAQEMINNFNESQTGGGSAEPETNNEETVTTSQSDYEFYRECKKDTVIESPATSVKVTGKESYSLAGKSYEFCCYEITYNIEKTSDKLCVIPSEKDAKNQDSVLLFRREGNGAYKPTMASMSINGKQCSYSFDENGKGSEEMCY